ncbi:putative peptidase family M1 domain [Lyophyllum shimeji]|uniref:Transcription initiation factor TFIID subunit 2 n=1 Tax=Lyophyllum shimeji TaxID=47721 RepID=A0A9P3PH57_LYOSH|nr:putative peptidase family M1 domain [Lyophyllum shimeji]
MDARINLQREHVRRGFSISHQKVVLEIDFSGSLWGYTEITIVPTSRELRTVYLNSRQCTIHTVTVAGHLADFTHVDPLTNITMGATTEAQDCHRHPELKRKLYSALQEGDEGELAIAIPREVPLNQSGQMATGAVHSEAATPEPQTPGFPHAQVVPEFSPITINITYSLRNPVDGFEFVLPTDSYPYRVPHAYTTPSSPDAARCWVPCVDNMWEKCTWEFEFIVPRYLEEREVGQDDEEPTDAIPTLVVCSGDLVEQVAHPYNSNKTIFLFSQSVLTSVQHIAFAAGPFHLHTIPADNTGDDGTGAAQSLIHAFCLPGHENFLPTSTSALRQAMTFYSTEFGSYPFGSYKVVFVEELPTQRFDSSTLSIVTTDLLHGDDAIEQALETRHALAHALACQWAGINILPKHWPDTWLVNGLSLYITGLFMRKLLGNNEYRFRLKKDMQRVLEWDIGGMPPICQPQVLEPPDSATLPFINLKAPLVLHILDRRLGKSGTSLGLSRVLPKLFLSAISGEMQNNALSTHAFLRMCRKVSGVDPRSFAEQWIYGSGCPSFGFSASFNRKKMAVEITMRQDAPAYLAMENNEVSKVLMKPVPFFEGQMTIRIHEADGTPYEHVLDIRSPFKRYEVPFNTKYKRVRRNTKRYLARQAAAQAAAEGDAEAAEAMCMVDMGFGLEVWEKESERENWKVADWTEEDEGTMSGATYEWIRMDADFEWIANIKFEQPDFMWVSQLQRDRDVVAQLEAINALAEKPTAIVSSTLTKTVLVSNYYFRIRCEAALALVTCAIRKLDFLGLFHLFKLFLRYCYDPEDPNQDLFAHTYVPKPNDFSDFAEYFVRKNLINAISRVRFENGKSPSVVRQFLIDQLRYNDNTANPYSDGFYICTIISAAAAATVSIAPPERGELLPSEVKNEQTAEDVDLLKQSLAEVDRYRSMDRLIPSPHNCVTIAALEFYMLLGIAGLIPNHPRVFFPLTREGNYTQVRIAAFDGLFVTKWYTPQIMRYVLAVMANDPSRIIRRHVARSACHSLALLVQMGEMKSSLKETESLLIEEDGTLPEKAKESKKSELDVMIKVLRKDREVGKNEVLREFLMPIALAPDANQEVRWCVLKLADLLIRPVEETPPTVKIHIPSTPVVDVAPQLPPVKVPVKAVRSIKSGGPPTKSPLASFNVPTKLRLPASPMLDAGPQTPATPRIETTKRNVAFTAPPPVPKAKVKAAKAPKAVGTIKAAPKAQSGGMTLNDLRASRNALKKLKANKHAFAFNQPVDPIRDHAPNYFDVIKDPMDLSTMGAKLEAGMYKDRFAFEADFRLMISNAKLYNVAGSYVHNEAISLELFFEKQWTIINKTLEAADKAHPPAPAAPSPKRAPRVLPPVPKAFPSPPPPPTPAAAAPARPTIKLKVGAQVKPPDTPEQAVVKPRARKPKVTEPPAVGQPPVDAPPPPYVDDGSHDILQEVLAIEREKDEMRQRATLEKEKERPPVNGVSGKRKKVDTLSEDDILALATPSKKERPSPPGPSTAVNKVKLVVPPAAKAAPPSHKAKVDKPIEPAIAPEVPRASAKGKEKEVPSPAPPRPAPKPRKPVFTATTINEKKCKDIMKTLQKLPEAAIFARPVDPQLDGCPTYYEEIANPMDLGTIMTKLSQNKYVTMEDFGKDVELVFSNCRQFNPPATFPVTCADVVERAFKKEWAKAMEKKLSWMEKRGLQGVMTALVKEPMSWVFREPVDPVLLGIPTYHDIIPKKNARDLKTIRQKLDADKYETVEAFEADIELMINNAITFNGLESEVGQIAISLRGKFNDLMESWRANSKKRKEGDKGTPQPTKKAKIG